MVTLNPDDGHIAMINTFEVEPENAPKLMKLLDDATEEVMKHLPGFVSANLHISLDGTKVVNYAQWRTADSWKTMLQNPTARTHMELAGKLAKSITPILYQLKSSHA